MDQRIGSLLFLLPFSTGLVAQNVLDGAYIKENTLTRQAVPRAHLREADVMVAQRVWRVIDVREKLNMPLFYRLEETSGRKSVFEVIRDGLLDDGSLTAYDVGPIAQDDAFTKPLTRTELEDLLNPVTTVWTDPLDGGDVQIPVEVPAPIGPEVITRYQIKEDWILDKQRGVMEVRITGIAPMREVRGDDGELRGHAPLFWLYYPELRFVLANAEAFNRQNDGERRSFQHLFEGRMFSSTVIKVSNVYDRKIGDVRTGVDALLEGGRVKNELFNAEHDLWSY